MPRWTADMQTELGRIRAEQGFTRNDAAYKFKLSLETLRRYENGGVSLPMEVAEAMTEYYGVPFEQIRVAARAVRQKWLAEHPE